jgi:TPP-dependent pyruvate/acetoin dehydrogenase alpha subunit
MATVEERAGSGGGRVSGDVLRGFYREMLLIRRFEEKVEERFRAGELPASCTSRSARRRWQQVSVRRSGART